MSFGARLATLFLVVRVSLRHHFLATAITVFSLALGSGLVMAVFSVSQQSERAFRGGDMHELVALVGGRGSKLQIVLNTIFHLESSPGNVPPSVYKEFQRRLEGRNGRPGPIEWIVPYALGDSYRGFRIVGTTESIFDQFEYADGTKLSIAKGHAFDPAQRTAVVGSFVSQETGLELGSTFLATHGIVPEEDTRALKHPGEFVVTGVLEPTNTPIDRVIFIPMEGVWRLGGGSAGANIGHELVNDAGERYVPKQGEPIPEEYHEVSALIVKFRSEAVARDFSRRINDEGNLATFVWPIASTMADLLKKMGWITQVLLLVAYLVIVVAAASVVSSLYNTMNERRREFAILRALGARKRHVFFVIVAEATTISFLGALAGYLVYGGIMFAAAMVIREQTGVHLNLLELHPAFYWTPVGMLALGALAGLLPAFKAYRTDVAQNLTPTT